jgi:hypothetical protein
MNDKFQESVTRSLLKMRVRNKSIVDGRAVDWIIKDIGFITEEVIERVGFVRETIKHLVWDDFCKEKWKRERSKLVK